MRSKVADWHDARYRVFLNRSIDQYLSEPGIRVKLQKTENYFSRTSRKKCRGGCELFFYIDEKNNPLILLIKVSDDHT